MGFKIVEYYIRSVISDGLAELRENVNEIDYIFADLTNHPTRRKFGEKVVDDIKRWFAHTDVPVLAAYGQNDIRLPSITVHLLSSQEEQEYRTFQDHWDYYRVPDSAAVLAGPIFGLSYDPDKGEIHFDQNVDLSKAIQGRKIFSSRIDAVLTIHGVQQTNDPGTAPQDRQSQFITVVDADGLPPATVDIAELYILSSIDFKAYRRAAAWFKEVFEIRANANTNTDQAIWLYYILAHILMRYKHRFEEVGLESQTFGASEFFRDVGKEPNTIWGRTIRFTFRVNHEWREPVNPLELEGINVNAENPLNNQIAGLT